MANKSDHRRQYPENTEYVYSNWTPRSCHYYPEATEGAVVFGIQYFIKEYLMKQFQQDFFNKPMVIPLLLRDRRKFTRDLRREALQLLTLYSV